MALEKKKEVEGMKGFGSLFFFKNCTAGGFWKV
jgi:hypothetical protein